MRRWVRDMPPLETLPEVLYSPDDDVWPDASGSVMLSSESQPTVEALEDMLRQGGHELCALRMLRGFHMQQALMGSYTVEQQQAMEYVIEVVSQSI